MPTIISHPAAAIALLPWFRRQIGRPGVFLTGAILTIAPDLDVIAFRLGIPYEHMLGHRGISHSLAAALLTGAVAAFAGARLWRLHFGLLWVYFFACMAAHGLMDMMTSGGLGIAVFAPFSNERYFFEFRPIAVSAIGVGDFASGRWTYVLESELRWIWLPSLALAAVGIIAGRFRLRGHEKAAAESREASPGPS
jgi:inner membrane protein